MPSESSDLRKPYPTNEHRYRKGKVCLRNYTPFILLATHTVAVYLGAIMMDLFG